MGNATDPVRQAQINEALRELSRCAQEVEQLSQSLTERLCGVLRPCPPAPGTMAKEQPRELKAPLADSLDVVSTTLSAANSRLQDLLQRLEI